MPLDHIMQGSNMKHDALSQVSPLNSSDLFSLNYVMKSHKYIEKRKIARDYVTNYTNKAKTVGGAPRQWEGRHIQ